jgi:hypothetical protein
MKIGVSIFIFSVNTKIKMDLSKCLPGKYPSHREKPKSQKSIF